MVANLGLLSLPEAQWNYVQLYQASYSQRHAAMQVVSLRVQSYRLSVSLYRCSRTGIAIRYDRKLTN